MKYNTLSKKIRNVEADDYWITKMEPEFLNTWETLNPICEEYYKSVSKPYYKKNNNGSI